MKRHQASHKQSATLKNDIGNKNNREKLISVAAYSRAEHSGLEGDSLADWLSAETEIGAILKNSKDINDY